MTHVKQPTFQGVHCPAGRCGSSRFYFLAVGIVLFAAALLHTPMGWKAIPFLYLRRERDASSQVAEFLTLRPYFSCVHFWSLATEEQFYFPVAPGGFSGAFQKDPDANLRGGHRGRIDLQGRFDSSCWRFELGPLHRVAGQDGFFAGRRDAGSGGARPTPGGMAEPDQALLRHGRMRSGSL